MARAGSSLQKAGLSTMMVGCCLSKAGVMSIEEMLKGLGKDPLRS